MSDRTILDRYVGRPPLTDLRGGGPFLEGDGEPEAFSCFGILRGARERSVGVELRKRTGEVLALPYSYVSRVVFSPATGLVIHCGSDEVRIRGRNLNHDVRPRVSLFGGLARHLVTWVSEAERAALVQAGATDVVVDAIEW